MVNEEHKTAVLIGVSIIADNIIKKDHKKIEKYKGLNRANKLNATLKINT